MNYCDCLGARHSRPYAAPGGASDPCTDTDEQLESEERRLAGVSDQVTYPVSAGSGSVLRIRSGQAHSTGLRTRGLGMTEGKLSRIIPHHSKEAKRLKASLALLRVGRREIHWHAR
jgi:hypothetical protein